MALLFKGGEQLYKEGLDLIGRKELNDAKKKFQAAIEKGFSDDGLAQIYIEIINVGNNRGDTGSYRSLITALNSTNKTNFKFGLTDIEVADLIAECELDAMEIEASSLPDYDFQAKSQAFIDCAGGFMARIGEKNLKFDEIYKGNTVATGNREALILQAQAYSILGKGTVSRDPKMAAEYMQMAYNFRRQLGDAGTEEMRLSEEYARSCKCWICGRPANAQGIHFMPMRSHIEPVFMDMANKDIVSPVSEDAGSIYVCMPCYTAISNKSDDIAREYYNDAIRELRATEARLQAEISSLRFSLSMRR